MKFLEFSNIGKRTINQDFILSKNLGEDKALFIVADGMGGYPLGDVAARIAAESIASGISKGLSIPEAVLSANHDLHRIIEKMSIPKMGCCFSGVNLDNNIARIFWIGDCRVYMFRHTELIFITKDHTMIAEMEKYGKVSYAQRTRYGHIVSRRFMGSETDTVDIYEIEVLPNDEFIICTDGLHKILSVEVLLGMLHNNTFNLKEHNEKFDDNHSFIYIKV